MEKLLFTGGTGFLGKNVMPILTKRYEVTTCGITPDDMIKANLAKEVPSLTEKYDVVLHACGKAHVVPKTEAEKQADKQDGMTYGIIIAVVIGGIVIWKKVNG